MTEKAELEIRLVALRAMEDVFHNNEDIMSSIEGEIETVERNLVRLIVEKKKKQPEKKVTDTIESLDDKFCQEVAKTYKLPLTQVLQKRNNMILYCRSTGKTYKDYRAALQLWLRKDKDA